MTQTVFGITGWKNSGKTTLVERLVSELTRRGYRVSTVKHAHHQFDIDKPGTDSHRHREAGAIEVALVSGYRWALMHELRGDDEPPLEAVLNRLSPCDLVLVEGYKREAHAKIEARRTGSSKDAPLTPGDPAIVAIASDHEVSGESVPVLDLNDIPAIADFIVNHCGLPRRDAI
ncbi:molybdopterin-guanine dinucleotide biosynthesis protein B [Breoghania sp.]|uniref:molybdopterin-guanine dinucleotide biosynthesis protein B n=1 Tax=Breoghania sp. TaxID=2065378 RepID=UPI002AA7619A|nr:molybdopterin-guanine dinucleotide biosynthesis protein B [Breoghania sp.]